KNIDDTDEVSTSNTVEDNETNVYKAVKDTEVNVKNYFDEVYRGCVDLEDLNTNSEMITI
ncbi:33382_t:CDS:1, partial [Racocetra persica]